MQPFVEIMQEKPKAPVTDANDLELAFHLAGVGLCISRDRIIQRCNKAFGEMFGYDAEELSGRSMECLYPSHAEFEHIGARGIAIMKDSGAYSDERIMKRKDGSLFWCHVVGRALYRDQPFACAVWSFEDLSVKRPVTVALTMREREIAQFLILGKASKEIASILKISTRTVEAHRARLHNKFGVRSATELMSKLGGFT
ncbi:MAG TPA: LuxR C-terminal-related transcriptional regulator [Burkholderiaceae bacterium]|jgi:PAS domain S-box-containing protein